MAAKLSVRRRGNPHSLAELGCEAELKARIEEWCQAAQQAVAKGGTESEARTILLWLPELCRWMDAHRKRLGGKPHNLALELLAQDFQTKSWVVQKALAATDGPPTEARVIHSIIVTSFRAWPEQVRKPGRPRDEDVARTIPIIAAYLHTQHKQKEFATRIFPGDPDSAFDSLRHFISNHQRPDRTLRSENDPARAQAMFNSLKTCLNRTSGNSEFPDV